MLQKVSALKVSTPQKSFYTIEKSLHRRNVFTLQKSLYTVEKSLNCRKVSELTALNKNKLGIFKNEVKKVLFFKSMRSLHFLKQVSKVPTKFFDQFKVSKITSYFFKSSKVSKVTTNFWHVSKMTNFLVCLKFVSNHREETI